MTEKEARDFIVKRIANATFTEIALLAINSQDVEVRKQAGLLLKDAGVFSGVKTDEPVSDK